MSSDIFISPRLGVLSNHKVTAFASALGGGQNSHYEESATPTPSGDDWFRVYV